MKTEIETVPLGDVKTVFYKHGASEPDTDAMLTFMVTVWLGNEVIMHEGLTKDCINIMELDEMSTNLLTVEVLPALLHIANLVHDSQKDRSLASHSVKDYVISLEFFP